MRGVLRVAELSQRYEGRGGALTAGGDHHRLEPGGVERGAPAIGDVHRVRNAFDDRVSISIHVYGANIGAVRRFVYGPSGRKEFVSGYANAPASQAQPRPATAAARFRTSLRAGPRWCCPARP